MTLISTEDHRAAGVVRVATLTARVGEMPALIRAAKANAAEARSQPGCLTADVCAVPDNPNRLIVLSRWESPEELSAFLRWHEGIAHQQIGQASSVKPHAVHYPLV